MAPLKGLLRRYKSSSFAYAFVAAAPGEPLGGIQVGVSGPHIGATKEVKVLLLLCLCFYGGGTWGTPRGDPGWSQWLSYREVRR